MATSGLAIASLVLAILWIGGVASLLAVIFGAVALSRIRRSFGRLTGRGLAIAGLVIGSVGIAGTVLLFVAAGVAVHDLPGNILGPRITHLSIGQAARPSTPSVSSLTSLTVKKFIEPVTPNVPGVTPTQGMTFAVIDVQVCAGANGSSSILPALALLLPNKTTVAVAQVTAMSPSLVQIQSLSPNGCGEGYLTYEVPVGVRPVAVRWIPHLFGQTFDWDVR